MKKLPAISIDDAANEAVRENNQEQVKGTAQNGGNIAVLIKNNSSIKAD